MKAVANRISRFGFNGKGREQIFYVYSNKFEIETQILPLISSKTQPESRNFILKIKNYSALKLGIYRTE